MRTDNLRYVDAPGDIRSEYLYDDSTHLMSKVRTPNTARVHAIKYFYDILGLVNKETDGNDTHLDRDRLSDEVWVRKATVKKYGGSCSCLSGEGSIISI
jgi:uncharacterized protein RhaS with RHS repeats